MSDFWDTAKGVLGTVAPTIATALGGPLAGIAVGALTKALGLTPGTSQTDLANAIAGATPDQLLAIKKAEDDFQVTMKRLDVDADKLVFDDRNSARTREIAVRDNTPRVLAYVLSAGFFGLLGTMCWHPFPSENQAALNIMLGSLGTAWAGAMAYFYGTTKGSGDKNWMLYQSTPPSP